MYLRSMCLCGSAASIMFYSSLFELFFELHHSSQQGYAAGHAKGEPFVHAMEQRIQCRQRIEIRKQSGAWILRETHCATLEAQNQSIGPFSAASFT